MGAVTTQPSVVMDLTISRMLKAGPGKQVVAVTNTATAGRGLMTIASPEERPLLEVAFSKIKVGISSPPLCLRWSPRSWENKD